MCFLFVDPHAFKRHFHLVNRGDLETILKAAIFVNEADNQVRATHKILGYDPIQKSFPTPKHVIRANDPRLQQITVAEHEFVFPEGSPISEGVPLAGPSSSHQQRRPRVIWVRPRKTLVHLIKSIYPRIPLVIWATLI